MSEKSHPSVRRVYLDNASTTPLHPAVLDAMLPCLRDEYGNPSSLHTRGRRARVVLEQARERIAGLLGARASEIVFTSGGTEADNLALHIAARESGRRGRRKALTSAAEHHAVLHPIEKLVLEDFDVAYLPLRRDGSILPEAFLELCADDVGFVSLMHVNNETGAVNPVAETAGTASERGAIFHTDAVQAVGKLPLDLHAAPFDLVSISAHKTNGPKGIGALYIRSGLRADPLMLGGSQERGRRGGTENAALAVGFAAALEISISEMASRAEHWRELRGGFLDLLLSELPSAVVNGGIHQQLAQIVSISFPSSAFPIDGELLAVNMDLEGFEISSGSACTSGAGTPSHVMKAIGHDEMTAAATVRISFGADTQRDESLLAAQALVKAVRLLLQRSMDR